MQNFDFTLNDYGKLITALRALGYSCESFMDAQPDRRHLLLRHDIDMSLSAAVRMAEIERCLSVRATYFILLDSEFYNVFSPESGKAIRQIIDNGHWIGLHFDASAHHPSDYDHVADWQCHILADLSGQPIDVISYHRPAPDLLGKSTPIAGRIHAYQPKFFSEMAYCSDSRGGWHYGHPLDLPSVRNGAALQLLTHPLWWDAEPGIDPVTKLNQFLIRRQTHLAAELARNCNIFPKRDHASD